MSLPASSEQARSNRPKSGATWRLVRRAVVGLFPSIRVLRLSAYLFVVFSVLGLIASRAVMAKMS